MCVCVCVCVCRSFGREGLAEAMMQLNGGMTVTEEEVNAMMDDAALDECVALPPPSVPCARCVASRQRVGV